MAGGIILLFILIIEENKVQDMMIYLRYSTSTPFTSFQLLLLAARKSHCLALSPSTSIWLNEACVTRTTRKDRSPTPKMKKKASHFGSTTVLFTKNSSIVLHPMPLYIMIWTSHACNLEPANCYADELIVNWPRNFYFRPFREIFLIFWNPRQGRALQWLCLRPGHAYD